MHKLVNIISGEDRMEKKIGVIGGSGVYNIDGIKILQEHDVETPFGRPSDNILEAELDGTQFCFLPRHGRGHTYLPSEVNYRANIFALKKLGVEYIISVSAVGSLVEECPPTSFVLVDQFIDWTKGKRERSFFGEGVIGHVSTAYPVENKLRELLAEGCSEVGIHFKNGGTYICIEGPQFSSRAESELYKSYGATVIGMTNVPESYLAKEAGIAYATVAMVTDFDCWKDEHCSVDEIMKVMQSNNVSAQNLLKNVLPKLATNPFGFEKENTVGVMTPKEKIPSEKIELLNVLLK
jgi:5'-methylthioadenosine phosphorylase